MTTRTLSVHLAAAVGAGVLGLCAPASAADNAVRAPDTDLSAAAPTSGDGMLSLVEVAPDLVWLAKRYRKFYGDPNTVLGDMVDRTQLFGDLDGARDDLVDKGLYIDVSATQFLQWNTTGGTERGASHRSNGSADVWAWLDAGKAGLWPGGAIFLHGEVQWGTGINDYVGSFLPANMDTVFPELGNPGQVALPDAYVMQALSEDLLLGVGKMSMAAFADQNPFANSERTQFSYTGLVNNPIPAGYFPYTSLGAWLTWMGGAEKQHIVTAAWSQNYGDATTSGIHDFTGDNSFALQYIRSLAIDGLPGHYLVAALYSNDERAEIAIPGPTGPALATDNYAVIANMAQYLWLEDGSPSASPRSGMPPVGGGIFARAGWQPQDRNVIDQFYSFGFGGYGAVLDGRDGDQWGLGWAGSHVSDDFRRLTGVARGWEHGYEAFYNFELSPAVHFTVDASVIRSAARGIDSTITVGARLQLDF